MSEKQRVAIVSSPNAGLGHYVAHLFGPLSKMCNPKFITYPQTDLSGFLTYQFTDNFMKRYIKWPRFDLEDTKPQSIVDIANYMKSRNIKAMNIHIGTTIKQKINYFIALTLYCKQVNNIRFVFTLHDVLPFDHDPKIINLLKVFYGLADHFVVGNKKEYRKLVRYYKTPAHKISIIRHGIYNLFDNNIYDKKIARSLLGIEQNKPVILFFGFLKEFKGFEYLIRAAKVVQKKYPDMIVYVASGLKYARKELVNRSLSLIHKLELQDNFILNLNYLDTNDIEAVFKAADMVVLPYTNASQSGVMMMSVGFKKPVVISDVFAEKEWIANKAGLVAENRNYKDYAEKIMSLIANPLQAIKFGQYGYKYAMEHLNWEDIAKKYYQTYLGVLQNHQPNERP